MALLVLFVFGEVGENKQVTPKYTALVAVVSDLMRPQGLRHLQGHLPHLGKLLGRFGLPESGGTVAVRFSPVESLLPDRAHQLRPIVALVAGDVFLFETEVDELAHGFTLNEHPRPGP